VLKRRLNASDWLYILPLAFLALFFFYPLGVVTWKGLAPGGRVDPGPFLTLWRQPYFLRALWFTL
jgi:ABC-type Fe3+ transport system permease subunit